jgi:hypothetical protein
MAVDDGEWHNLQLICLKGQSIKLMLDNLKIGENSDVDQSNFDWATQICFGYSYDAGSRFFTGSIRNFRYEQHNEQIEQKNIKFEKFTYKVEA